MSKKTPIYRNYRLEGELVRDTKKLIELTSRAGELLDEVTQGNVEKFDITAIDNYLNTTTKFLNAEMSANALNVLKQYNELKSAISFIKKNQHLNKYIKKGDVDTQAIETATTEYLSDEKQEAYNKVAKAIEVINKHLSPTGFNRCTRIDFAKGLIIDASQFNHAVN